MEKIIKGIPASVGIASQKIIKIENANIEIDKSQSFDSQKELSKLEKALLETKEQLLQVKENALKNIGEQEAMVFDAHIQMASDPALLNDVKKLINEGFSSMHSVKESAEKMANMFENMESEYMQERAADIRDVSSRIVKNISGTKSTDLSKINEEVILAAEDLTPSQTAILNKEFVKGFITKIGGRTSHTAIMAQSMGIPAIVGLAQEYESIEDGQEIIMDGAEGLIYLNAKPETLEKIKEKESLMKDFESDLESYKKIKTETKDGHHCEVVSNVGSIKDINKAIEVNSDGVGLFRTEFLYMESKQWPTEEEQFNVYKEALETVEGKRVVIRLLDIGGDKKLDYYDFPEEENPFLGYRAIRMQMDNKEVFETQIKALLRASEFGNLAINIPMVSTIEELINVKKEIKLIEDELKSEGVAVGNYEIGIMVEVPSVVELIDKFVKYVDFVSIGTNDLIQYTFAADRMSKSVSYLYQPYNPSILRKLNKIIKTAKEANVRSAICGELAAEKDLVPVLVGMGLEEFSVSTSSSLAIKKIIKNTDKKTSEKLVEEVLDCETQDEVIEKIKNIKEVNYV